MFISGTADALVAVECGEAALCLSSSIGKPFLSTVCSYVVSWVGAKDGAPNIIPE